MVCMNFQKYDFLIEDLKKRMIHNDELLSIYDEKARLAKVNQFSDRFKFALVLSSFIVFVSLFMVLGFSAILMHQIPSLLVLSSTLGISFLSGVIVEALFHKKFRLKKRFRAFSNAKTESEKLEEQVHYEIEKEKLKQRNVVLSSTIDLLEKQQSLLETISKQYDLSKKMGCREEESLSALAQEQYSQLDTIITKRSLCQKFQNLRGKGSGLKKSFLWSLLTGAGFSICTGLLLGPTVLLPVFGVSFSSVFSVMTGYFVKQHHDQKKVFQRFNQKLGSETLSTVQEQEKLRILLEQAIDSLCQIEVQMQEQKLESSDDPKEHSDFVGPKRQIESVYSSKPKVKQFCKEEYLWK